MFCLCHTEIQFENCIGTTGNLFETCGEFNVKDTLLHLFQYFRVHEILTKHNEFIFNSGQIDGKFRNKILFFGNDVKFSPNRKIRCTP